MAKVQGKQSESKGSNCITVVKGIIYVSYGCTEGFPDVKLFIIMSYKEY
jgi:hypothetical protein